MGYQHSSVIVFCQFVRGFGFHQTDGLFFPACHVARAEFAKIKLAIG
jgi:hypothetical protein